MDTNRVDEVTIVGGGTAGWLTAAFLVTALNAQRPARPVRINVIVSPNVPSIGVGESTLPIMPQLLQLLGIDENRFFAHTNATFKLAGRFVHWNVDDKGHPLTFITPFNGAEPVQGYHPSYYYNQHGPVHPGRAYADHVLPTGAVIEAMKGPRTLDMQPYEAAIGYSYHLDARLFAEILQAISIERGVNFISDDVEAVEQDEQGNIASLRLRERGDFPVQLVVDCTGFRGLLIKEVLGEPFESYRPYFLCDRAYPVMVEHEHPKKILPATTATGLSAGWMWQVPLYNRVGTGYVYSSAFISDEEAREELLARLGKRGERPLNEPRVVKFEVGVLRRSWVKNVVAIGLSGGFVEPLEATAIGMIEKAARWLAGYFPDMRMSPEIRDQYNALMDRAQREIRDFIFMHYWLSNRLDTPFWRAVRFDMREPDSLAERLALYSRVLPTEDTTLGHQMFNWENYLFALYGKGFLHKTRAPVQYSTTAGPWKQYAAMVDQARDNMLRHLPGHYDLLTRIRERAERA